MSDKYEKSVTIETLPDGWQVTWDFGGSGGSLPFDIHANALAFVERLANSVNPPLVPKVKP